MESSEITKQEVGPEVSPLVRENERLHRDLDRAAARLVVLESERDAARGNFNQAIIDRDRAVVRAEQLERENAALLERVQRSVP